jgi:hypothetical protein
VHQHQQASLQRGRLKPQPRWPKPSQLNSTQWKQQLQNAWDDITHSPQAEQLQQSMQQVPTQGGIQTEWNLYMHLITLA